MLEVAVHHCAALHSPLRTALSVRLHGAGAGSLHLTCVFHRSRLLRGQAAELRSLACWLTCDVVWVQAYETALAQMRDNREAIDKLVEVLLEEETIDGNRFREIISKYATIPQENVDAVLKNREPEPGLVAA